MPHFSKSENSDIYNSILLSIINKKPSQLCFNSLSILRHGSHIYRFPACHLVKTHFLLENQEILEPSLCQLENFQRTLNIFVILLHNFSFFILATSSVRSFSDVTRNNSFVLSGQQGQHSFRRKILIHNT